MRVLLVTRSHPPKCSSVTLHTVALALVAHGHDVVGLARSESSASSAIRAAGGRRAQAVPGHGYPVWSSPAPERALPRLLRLFEPHVVFDAFDGDRATVLAACESALQAVAGARTLPAAGALDAELGLSVVIPAYNAQRTLGQQLDALLAQRWASGFEVIVADNGSSDDTADLVRHRMNEDPRLRLVDASGVRGECHARNVGAAAAGAESIAFCDADDVVSDGWVEAMGEALRDHALVAGRVEVQTLNPPGVAQSRGRAIADGPGRFGTIPFAHGCNIGIRRSTMEAVGGWDESIQTGPDIELCVRLWHSGVTLYYEPAAEIHYRYRDTESDRWRQAVRYGAAHVDMARRLEVRQRERPSRLHGLRTLAWLVRHCPDVLDTTRRPHWIWTAGLSAGHIRGSVRWRTMYL